MIRYLVIVAALIAGLSSAQAAPVSVLIDVSQQRMYVSVSGHAKYSWPISTARAGYRTPRGSFRPTRMYVEYYSRKYHNSPMPHSIFFYGGYAIHGTTATKSLGSPASHGCVRLHPTNARRLYRLVKANGASATRIRVRS